ncbi:DIMBOA UDP-glucosyltransferase BX8-like [Oryza brachyantha]|uniref:DIMBOA UDP-glucosyltransferase BX8-like n=1 Tax=Oryza brachyantha TaxID=4533 RepID=UPI001ADA1E1E|nr:DIMBOA UDP-glucosyltransferase BX8-like [Oryza brachyantha]
MVLPLSRGVWPCAKSRAQITETSFCFCIAPREAMTPPPSPAIESGAAAAGYGRRRRHVLLFPLPYQGHINPMFRLAGVLHARGFAVTVFHTHFNAPDAARHPEYRFVPVPDGASGPRPVSVEDVVQHILALNGACEAAFRDRLAAVLDEYSRDAVTCLVADAHLLRMVEVASRLAVPTLVLRTGSAACFAGFVAYPLLCDKGYLPVQESSQLDMPVSELPPYRVRDLMHVGRDGHELMCELLARAVAAVKLSSGLILNTFDAIEAPELAKLRRDLAVPVFDIGPLHKFSPAAGGSLLRQDRSCLEWLDAQAPESVLYVSFGSLACMGARELEETAWGIAGSGVPFLWVVRPGLVRGCAPHEPTRLPEGFDAVTRGRGVVVAWAPQEEALRHRAVGGFWTHCGWNSMAESLGEGVPMLCRPSFGDQMGNARYVEHVWEVGFEVGDGGVELERGAVEAAIRRLMAESDGAEMRARARELKKAAAECTGEAGSSELAIVKMVAHMLSM